MGTLHHPHSDSEGLSLLRHYVIMKRRWLIYNAKSHPSLRAMLLLVRSSGSGLLTAERRVLEAAICSEKGVSTFFPLHPRRLPARVRQPHQSHDSQLTLLVVITYQQDSCGSSGRPDCQFRTCYGVRQHYTRGDARFLE